ncbi:MAG: lipid-A-disaccharide synthase [Bdellovibrionales bacterium]|nr:lipid-A-disaccharide synthase [Bdellovibrionales bacterium]
MSRVLIVAGEASSSLYAQRLIEHWKREGRTVETFGIGSRSMESLGFRCLGRSEEMAVVGLMEVIRHFPLIRRVYHSLLEECDRAKPDVALLLDYPDFNLRLAKDLKKRGIKVVYYISPQVWAWRRGRVKLIKKVVDEMLVLFPFEETFYREHGVKAAFVGHPLLDELDHLSKDVELSRQRFGLKNDELVLGLMPGSRESELKNHLKEQLSAAELLTRRYPKIRAVLLCAPTIERERLQAAASDISTPIQIIKSEPFEMIGVCDFLLVASGTATLMVGLLEKPMVIMYRMSAITAWFAKRLVKHTRFFGMVNLVMDREVARELFQEEASAAGMATELEKFVDDGARRAKMIELKELKARLGSQGATVRVAAALEPYLNQGGRSG